MSLITTIADAAIVAVMALTQSVVPLAVFAVALLLPRLVLATESGLRARIQNPDYLVEGLKVYLSLAGNAPMDPALLEAFFALEAENRSKEAAASAKRSARAFSRMSE